MAGEGTFANLYGIFLQNIKKNLHIVLVFMGMNQKSILQRENFAIYIFNLTGRIQINHFVACLLANMSSNRTRSGRRGNLRQPLRNFFAKYQKEFAHRTLHVSDRKWLQEQIEVSIFFKWAKLGKICLE